MNLKELSPESIKEFSGSTIYSRGIEYYSSSKVNHVKYSIEDSCITGKVSGSYNYKIKVEIEDNYDLNSQCSCPYDGYPCKHIVALLLEIFYHKDDYVKQAKLEHKEHLSLEDKVEKLSKEELVTIVKNAIKKYPDLKNELKIYLNKNSVSAIKDLKKQVEKMFASVDSKSPNELKNIIKQIKNFMKTIKDSVPKIRVELKEKLLEEALTLYLGAINDSDYEPSYDEYNDYFEVDTSDLEEIIYNISKEITNLIKENHQFVQERKKLVKLFASYAIKSNLALENLFDYAEELCYNQDDFSLIIDEFTEDDLNNSHRRRVMTYFYGKAGKHDKQIHILESNLIYVSDY